MQLQEKLKGVEERNMLSMGSPVHLLTQQAEESQPPLSKVENMDLKMWDWL